MLLGCWVASGQAHQLHNGTFEEPALAAVLPAAHSVFPKSTNCILLFKKKQITTITFKKKFPSLSLTTSIWHFEAIISPALHKLETFTKRDCFHSRSMLFWWLKLCFSSVTVYLLPFADLSYYSFLKVRSFLPPLPALLFPHDSVCSTSQHCLLREKDAWGLRAGSGMHGKDSSFAFFLAAAGC